jgi:DNA adenine methylase
VIFIIRSPLRYPGGKSRAISKMIEFFPSQISEFREPMVGGGSLFIFIRQQFPDIKVKINDINRDLFCFWKIARDKNDDLVKEIRDIKKHRKNGKVLFNDLKQQLNCDSLSDFERAVNYFILNRISFSGLTTSGGYSNDAFKKRFTESSIDRILDLKKILKNVVITNEDYSRLMNGSKRNVLIYLDPPYLKNKNSKLYGKNGDLHLNFDHDSFYEEIISCDHYLLITYDNSIKNIKKFHESEKFFLSFMNMQYGMNNIARSRIPKKKELIITNYKSVMNTKQELINFHHHKFDKSLKNQILSSIINEIDINVGHWKKVSTLRKNIYNKNGFKKSIAEQDFNFLFHDSISFLKNKKYLDLSRRKGCGNILFKLYKWELEQIKNIVLNS